MKIEIAAFVLVSWISIAWMANRAIHLIPAKCKSVVRWLYSQTFEILILIFLGFLRIFSLFQKDSVPTSSPGHPILLVHGYLHAGFVWLFHKRRLSRLGFGPIYTIDLGHPFRSIRDYAYLVEKKARQIELETGSSELTLIGHSMGGLVSAYYATKLARPASVVKVITIASPLQGTAVAKIGIGRCAREMECRSTLIQEIDVAIRGSKIPFYHMATKTDQIVFPYTSSLRGSPKHQYIVEDVGHASLLFSSRIATKLSQWLVVEE
jgi:triacylglycerol lipase